MSIRFINGSLDPLMQPNFYDAQQLDVDDLEQLQVYTNNKIEESVKNCAFNGRTSINGLMVETDYIMAEPFAFPLIPQSNVNPELQNYRVFPEDILDLNDAKMYQVFKAEANNLQRLDLKVQLIPGAGNCTLMVELVELSVPSNPLSALSLNSVYTKQFTSDEIPTLSSTGLLSIDISNQNNGQGISVITGNYYAILIRFIRESGSQDQLKVYHSNVSETATISSNYYAHFWTNTQYQQGIYNEEAVLINMTLYHKVYTAAVQIQPGKAYFDGKLIVVDTVQRFLSIVDRENIVDTNEHFNYVAIKPVLNATSPELHPRTKNVIDSRYVDSFEAVVFNQIGWDVEMQKSQPEYLLLAVVADRNIITFNVQQDFAVTGNTNLAFNDWLNPCIVNPSLQALQIKASKPNDFVFFVSNIPAEVPLLDDNGQPVFDTTGAAIIDRIAHVYLVIYLDGAVNTRKFEMSLHSSTPTTPPFNNYYVAITESESTNIDSFTFDISEFTPNTFYNYVALTERGRQIFIQDYNVQVRTPNPQSGLLQDVRERTFDVNLNAGDLTIAINEDLKLGQAVAPYGTVGQRVIGFDSILYTDEALRHVGTNPSTTINAVTDTLLEDSAFKFKPLPMCFSSGVLVDDTLASVTDAVTATDLDITVNGVSVTWSGTEGIERGGLGAPHTVSGRVIFSDDMVERQQQIDDLANSLGLTLTPPATEFTLEDLQGMRVTLRDSNGRNNTQQGIDFVTNIDLDSSHLIYRAIAMGKGIGSDAGFSVGELGFVYFENRVSKDIVGVPLQFTFAPFGSSILDVRDIEVQEQWFGERTIVYATSSATVTEFQIGISPSTGQVFFNAHDLELLFHQLYVTAIVHYKQLDERYEIVFYYKTRWAPWGDSNDCAIINNDASVYQAVLNGDIIIKVNGSSLVPRHDNPLLTVDLTNPANVVSSPPRDRIETKVVSSIIRSGLVATATSVGHGWITGDIVVITGAAQAAYNGSFYITVIDGDTFTYSVSGAPITPATGTITASKDGTGEVLLDVNKVSVDPFLGKVVFGDNIRPLSSANVTLTYYYRKPIVVCATNQLGSSYDVRYDFNADGRVDEVDLNMFLQSYGSSSTDANYSTTYDFNLDGNVDETDYLEFLDFFGTVSTGIPEYVPATLIRLNSILVFKKRGVYQQVRVIKAVSQPSSIDYPLGRSILFLSASTPIPEANEYVVMFAYASTLLTGSSSIVVNTTQPLASKVTVDMVEIFNVDNLTDTRSAIDITSEIVNINNTTTYNNTITFTPSIISGTFVFRSLWRARGLAIANSNEYINSVMYEDKYRQRFGPFKMTHKGTDFEADGTSMIVRFDPTAGETKYVDGSNDSLGLHICGESIYNMRFTAFLLVPSPSNSNVMEIWRWHHIVPNSVDGGIRLEFGEFLSMDSRYRGRGNIPVLQPFGVAQSQVALKPEYAGGNIKNDLSNLIIIRDDMTPNYALIHTHTSDEQGGVVTSKEIAFYDPQARFYVGNTTDVIYQIHDQLVSDVERLDATIRGMQFDTTQIMHHDHLSQFSSVSGILPLSEVINQIIDFIAWDRL